jgi:hypothetical protein
MSFDFCGYILLFVALGCSMVALHLVGEMRTEDIPLIIALSVVCVLSAVIFILVELYTKKHPVVPLRLMVNNGTGLICLGQICLVFCQYGVRKPPLSCFQISSELTKHIHSSSQTLQTLSFVLKTRRTVLWDSYQLSARWELRLEPSALGIC